MRVICHSRCPLAIPNGNQFVAQENPQNGQDGVLLYPMMVCESVNAISVPIQPFGDMVFCNFVDSVIVDHASHFISDLAGRTTRPVFTLYLVG